MRSEERCIGCGGAATTTLRLEPPRCLVARLCDDCLDRYARRAVYFIRAGDLVKIGHSVNPPQRLRMLRTGSPVPLEFWHLEAGGKDRERELHERFAADRAHGEWFHISDAIREYVEAA